MTSISESMMRLWYDVTAAGGRPDCFVMGPRDADALAAEMESKLKLKLKLKRVTAFNGLRIHVRHDLQLGTIYCGVGAEFGVDSADLGERA